MSQCCKSNFWLGLGLGSLLGIVCSRYAQTSKGQEMKEKMADAIHRASDKANDLWQQAKEKMMDTGVKAADKLAEGAKEMAGKASDMKEKIHEFTNSKR
ncbi:MAG: YtxH domain-containing protein [Bacteroidaceae bacterium]|nr:YtxH domain-containing protein [Bacteroidaceae bacterium]